jgi:UDP-glucose 4-epimerase
MTANGRPAEPDRLPRVLVTGGLGFIGSHLARELVRCGHSVVLVDNLSSGRAGNVADIQGDARVRFAYLDVTDHDALDRAAGTCDLIFHLAAAVGVDYVVRHPAETIHANVGGTESVLSVAAKRGLPVLFASTSEVYGKGCKIPFAEDDDVLIGPTSRSRWSYAASKMVDEFLALAYVDRGVPAVVFRLFNTVGPRQTGRYGMVLPRFVEAALRGGDLEVYGDGSQSRCFLHVADAVAAMLALADCPPAVGHVFNVGATEPVTIHRLAERVLERVESIAGRTGGKIVFRRPEEVLGLGYEDVHNRIPDISKIRRFTGWQPTRTLDAVLDDLIAHTAAELGLPAGGEPALRRPGTETGGAFHDCTT